MAEADAKVQDRATEIAGKVKKKVEGKEDKLWENELGKLDIPLTRAQLAGAFVATAIVSGWLSTSIFGGGGIDKQELANITEQYEKAVEQVKNRPVGVNQTDLRQTIYMQLHPETGEPVVSFPLGYLKDKPRITVKGQEEILTFSETLEELGERVQRPMFDEFAPIASNDDWNSGARVVLEGKVLSSPDLRECFENLRIENITTNYDALEGADKTMFWAYTGAADGDQITIKGGPAGEDKEPVPGACP